VAFDSYERSEKSDTFASHFACQFPKGKQVTPGDIRTIMNFKVLWQGNPISCMKTFRKLEKGSRFYEHNNSMQYSTN